MRAPRNDYELLAWLTAITFIVLILAFSYALYSRWW